MKDSNQIRFKNFNDVFGDLGEPKTAEERSLRSKDSQICWQSDFRVVGTSSEGGPADGATIITSFEAEETKRGEDNRSRSAGERGYGALTAEVGLLLINELLFCSSQPKSNVAWLEAAVFAEARKRCTALLTICLLAMDQAVVRLSGGADGEEALKSGEVHERKSFLGLRVYHGAVDWQHPSISSMVPSSGVGDYDDDCPFLHNGCPRVLRGDHQTKGPSRLACRELCNRKPPFLPDIIGVYFRGGEYSHKDGSGCTSIPRP